MLVIKTKGMSEELVFNGRTKYHRTMLTTLSTSLILLLTSKGQQKRPSQLMSSCAWLRTTFCAGSIIVACLSYCQVLLDFAGLRRTTVIMRPKNHWVQTQLNVYNMTNAIVSEYLVEIFDPVESAFKDQFCSLLCILPQVGDVPGR